MIVKWTVDPDTLNRIKEFLTELEIQIFQTGEQLLDLIKKNNRALIPVMLVTERPDRVVVNLAAGKIILLISGSPFAVVLPTVMKDFMASMEDIYQTFWVTKFLQLLRYIVSQSVRLPSEAEYWPRSASPS
ncbi:spore germination protein [Bacillus sp. ISL-18]|uniref:spore germination protein n=1 Tax=Bacillus sp. ISL-18 TaxID=2819118 RepID=UPI001BE85BA5|nr:spore germination protein [Bacillus sp. ISL-18]MBT2658241.1 spore germination protein [Bacillus sp. ISL-18]